MIFYALLVSIWEAVSRSGIWPPYLFPAPSDVVKAFVWGFQDKSFVTAMVVSVQRIVIGYAISVFLGVVLGLLIGRFKILDETLGSLMLGLQVLPSICWLPLAILWFGLSEQAIQFVVVMGAFLSIAIATDSGIRNIPPIYVRAAKTMGVKGFGLYRRVILPAALPSIITGMKLGWSFAWRSLMAGELLFVSVGLGQLLQTGRELHDIAQVVAVMIMIASIGLIFDRLIFAELEKKVRLKWGVSSN